MLSLLSQSANLTQRKFLVIYFYKYHYCITKMVFSTTHNHGFYNIAFLFCLLPFVLLKGVNPFSKNFCLKSKISHPSNIKKLSFLRFSRNVQTISSLIIQCQGTSVLGILTHHLALWPYSCYWLDYPAYWIVVELSSVLDA